MRIAGHPLHVMLVHFPVALWPAHLIFHAAARWLPTGVAGSAGFWLLLVGTAVGWIAVACGAVDWFALVREGVPQKVKDATRHGVINAAVLMGFTAILGREWSRYPGIVHGTAFLVGEALLVALLCLGNYFGGAVIWRGGGGQHAA